MWFLLQRFSFKNTYLDFSIFAPLYKWNDYTIEYLFISFFYTLNPTSVVKMSNVLFIWAIGTPLPWKHIFVGCLQERNKCDSLSPLLSFNSYSTVSTCGPWRFDWWIGLETKRPIAALILEVSFKIDALDRKEL